MPAQRKRRARYWSTGQASRAPIVATLGAAFPPAADGFSLAPISNMNTLDLTGRGAVITGGAAGIGLAVAQRVAASGARLSLWDRDAGALQAAARALGGDVHTVPVDIASDPDVQRARDQSVAALKTVDVLVCSAGITGPNTTTWEYPVDAWQQVLAVNLTGLFLCNRAFVPHMMTRDYGRIVNIASIAGKEGNPNASAYSASKAGVISLTKSLGKELAKTGIRVNCVTPAAVKTGIFSQMTQSHIDFMLSKIPMGRFGDVEEIAALVAWLCTEDCSFTTGAVFDLSGGRAVY
jgi:3-oxoacyl-[acyl-carrier protein] reductase